MAACLSGDVNYSRLAALFPRIPRERTIRSCLCAEDTRRPAEKERERRGKRNDNREAVTEMTDRGLSL